MKGTTEQEQFVLFSRQIDDMVLPLWVVVQLDPPSEGGAWVITEGMSIAAGKEHDIAIPELDRLCRPFDLHVGSPSAKV